MTVAGSAAPISAARFVLKTYMWAWHTAVLNGDPAARRNCTLALQDASGGRPC